MTYALIYCPDCLQDIEIDELRGIDARCVHCGEGFCAYHIGIHLQDKHSIRLEPKKMKLEGEKGTKGHG
jgi:hypothetical protein